MDVEAMANRNRRKALRGAEIDVLDLVSESLTSKQWAEWLKAPLESAAAQGKRDLAQRLVRAGAGIRDALHEAVRCGYGEIADDLLESGASIAAKDIDGDTPLHIAARQGETEMVQLLLHKGADKDALDRHEWTPLYLAAYHGHSGAVLALLAAGADVSLRCGQFETPVIQRAAERGHVDILRAMIEHGADVDAVDSEQDTALHLAAQLDRTTAVSMLVEAGANIDARSRDDGTPLHVAADRLCRNALRSLLKHGADADAQNDHLQTPLMIAAQFAGTEESAEVVESLLRAGADETIVDEDGKKAADMVGVHGEEEGLAEDIDRVRKLLANAPADRAWRRRGYLVLCRAYSDRMQQSRVVSGTRHTNAAPRSRSCAKPARAEMVAGLITADESRGGDWTIVVAKVLDLQEEGIFRTIMGYL